MNACSHFKTITLTSHTERNPNRKFKKCQECGKFLFWLDEAPGLWGAGKPAPSHLPSPQANVTTGLPAPQESGVDSDSPTVFSLTVDAERVSVSPQRDAPEVKTIQPRVDSSPSGNGFSPSKYQSAVFEFVKSGAGHGLIDAKAGSGKTTTVEKAIAYTDVFSDVIYLAFNKRIVAEAKARMPEHCKVATTHSQGYSNIRAALGKVELDERKTYNLLEEYTSHLQSSIVDRGDMAEWKKVRDEAKLIDDNAALVNQLVGLCKNTLSETDPASLDQLADRYGVTVNGEGASIYRAVAWAVEQSRTQTQVIDFDDMLWYCAIGLVPCEQFDFVFIDEAQDLNRAQIEFVLKSVRSDGRIVAVGDEAQSIYGFRGADVDAIPNLTRALSATLLPLSICYRCPTSHIKLAQAIVPEIEPRENAPLGIVSSITEDSMLKMVRPGDMVICRVNAPLVKPAFELIRRGVKAVIVGRDIGKGLMGLLDKVAKRYNTTTLGDTLKALSDHTSREVYKLLNAHKNNQAQSLQDQCETLIALADGCATHDDLERKIESVFREEAAGVAFSSVHRAKGLEAERVFLLHPELIPHPMAEAEWEKKQEMNLKYVAVTRSKSELYFVSSD